MYVELLIYFIIAENLPSDRYVSVWGGKHRCHIDTTWYRDSSHHTTLNVKIEHMLHIAVMVNMALSIVLQHYVYQFVSSNMICRSSFLLCKYRVFILLQNDGVAYGFPSAQCRQCW